MRRLLIATFLLASPALADTTDWNGNSIALRVIERGVICQAGALTIKLDGQAITAILAENGSQLAGTVKSDGTIEMSGRKGAFIFSFTGKRTDQKMRGSWIDAGSGCGGTWSAKPSGTTD